MGRVTGPVRGLSGCGCGSGAGGHGVVDRPDAAGSGWYPPEADTPEKRLRCYARQFPLVEVDATYYALPAEQTAPLWAARTPDGSPSMSRLSASTPAIPPRWPHCQW